MTHLVERGEIITMVQEAMDSGARQDRACTVISLSERTLQGKSLRLSAYSS